MKRNISPRVWMLLAAGIPCAVVIWVNVWFVWNHFVEGPYLHDSGWYSAIVWRAGVLPKNPLSVHQIRDYYGIHVSPLVSLGSILSYLAPIGRVRWYCVFQAAIFAPLGAAVAMLVRRDARASTLGEALLVGVVALVFALDGQVIACIGYPHFEIFISTGVCLMLVGLATGRTRIAWIGLVCAAATREDGGFHAASFLAAAFVSDVTGKAFPVPRRTVVVMTFAAAGAAVLAFVVQKSFFMSANLFRHEYLGEPAYAHITGAVLAKRMRAVFEHAGFVSFPLIATVAVAVARRDPRYLLGWVAELPWLLLNLFAFQELKSVFTIYTGFPFVGSIFWVGAYASAVDRGATGRGWLGSLGLVSGFATLGLCFGNWGGFVFFLHFATWPTSQPSKQIEELAAKLDEDPRAYGHLLLDPGVTSWALAKTTAQERVFATFDVRSFDGVDGAVFYLDGAWRRRLFWFLARSPFTKCGRIEGTKVHYCGREEHPMPPMFVPASPLVAALLPDVGTVKQADHFVVPPREQSAVAVFGPYVDLPKGSYTARWRLSWGTCIDRSTKGLGVAEVVSSDGLVTNHFLEESERSVELPFDLDHEAKNIELRTWSGRCGYVVEDVSLAARSELPIEPPP